MIVIDHVEIVGIEPAIRGMRNPMNSWEKSDSGYGCELNQCSKCAYDVDTCGRDQEYRIGVNDEELMYKLAQNGPCHAKYRRMIVVYCDITAPWYWWKEFDTYKVGTVSNSCSSAHTLLNREFTAGMFSFEKIDLNDCKDGTIMIAELLILLNKLRMGYLAEKDPVKRHKIWYTIIQLLPSSYNQKRTIMLNYEVLANIYRYRHNHKLEEWLDFCKWITTLPLHWLITKDCIHNDVVY